MSGSNRVVVIGAGPAGVEAAITLSKYGIRPLLLDEAESVGGQIFRQPPKAMSDRRVASELYGFDGSKAVKVHAAVEEALGVGVEYKSLATVWSADQESIHYIQNGKSECVLWSDLIIATGAMDRIVPLHGWTAPGVYSLGAAQIALKAQSVLVGDSIVFFGTGPLLYYVAYQYLRAGAKVKAVLDVSKRVGARMLLSFTSGGSDILRGIYYVSYLKAHGVKVASSISPKEILVDDQGNAAGLKFLLSGGEECSISSKAVAFGYGLKPETQISDLLDLSFTFDELFRYWVPQSDGECRSSNERVFLAGDGAGVRGAVLAALTGRRAAYVLLAKLGIQPPVAEVRQVSAEIARAQGFRLALERAFPFPAALAQTVPDDVLVCRCEGVTAGQIRQAVDVSGEAEINRIKAFTRVGMGRCQGRLCMSTAAEICAAHNKMDVRAVGRPRGQAPVKPIPLAQLGRQL